MSTEKEITPVLMYQDDQKIEKSKIHVQSLIKGINKGFRAAETFLERKLTPEELEQVSLKGWPWVLDEIRKEFQFKNASDEFNFEAMGKDFISCKHDLLNIVSFYRSWDFEIIDGEARLSEKGENSIIENSRIYADNKFQIEAYKLAQKLSKDLNRLCELGFMGGSPGNVNQIGRAIGILRNTYVKTGAPGKEVIRFEPHPERIKRLNEQGNIMGY